MVLERRYDPATLNDWGALQPEELEGLPSDVVEAIRAAIDDLPEDQRDAVNAVFYERIPPKTYARQVGTSDWYVRRRLAKALEVIRAVIEAEAL